MIERKGKSIVSKIDLNIEAGNIPLYNNKGIFML